MTVDRKKMNQDVDADDQMVRSASHETPKVDLDFVSAINERQLGFTKKTHFSSTQINVTAEDELVKKQFREKHCELPGVPRSTFLMEFSPDGTKVASTHGNHQIYVTDVRTGKHIKTLIGHPRTPWCIAFHPTSNQIIASGCLGGQVRIWDLSGGSEVWTSETPSVIASIAFHPDDRLLVIATFNELFFWDWSKPEPFVRVATASVKEKVRYVAFDKLGHKLITGITNSPQTRWERVRTVPVSVSVPVNPMFRPRRTERRIVAPRFNWPTPNNNNNTNTNNNNVSTPAAPSASTATTSNSEPLSSIPERERRITSCYRELVHQYEVLVHRYLQIYRRPIMIDQGTDPMEIETNNQPTTSSQSTTNTRPDSPIPSTSGLQRPPRKSSVAHPPKNRRRIIYRPDSGGSSSSSSAEDQGKTSDSIPGESRGSTSSKPAIDKPKPETCSSSSSDDDDAGSSNVKNEPSSSNSNVGSARQFTPARQLRINRVPPPKNEENTRHPPQTSTEKRATRSARVKCFATPNRAIDPSASSSSNSNQNMPSASRGGASSSNRKEDDMNKLMKETELLLTRVARNDNINHLINKTKLMISSYQDAMQQDRLLLHLLRGGNLPELPTTSSSSMNQPGPSNKPSKGTNTSEIEPPTNRKRRSLRPHLLGNILFTSSDDSSSDEVADAPPRNKPPVPTPTPTTTEHSYAVDTPPVQSSSGSNPEPRVNRKRRLQNDSEVNDFQCRPSANRLDAIKRRLIANAIRLETDEMPSLPNLPIPSTSNDRPRSESLMDRQMQRLVVESLSVLDGPSTSDTTTPTNNTPTTTMAGGSRDDSRLCGACGGQLEENESRSPEGCARTATICTRVHHPRANTSSSGHSSTSRMGPTRRRFFSHRLSAFHPTRFLHRMLRGRGGASASSRGRESPMPVNFAEDEVINFSERDAEETPPTSSASSSTARNYHPFDPPPEMLSINPENIGIGSMYSNIVQELESSLNDVRNIRFRLGEMSEMLSNFSDRLENIMTQSNTILRNLSSSLEDLPANEGGEQRAQPTPPQRPARSGFSENSSYSVVDDIMNSTPWVCTYRAPYANNPVNSDHTYPINPEATQNATLSPLHLSLQLTVTHIQRQARLLRQQVESIERIDRAMIEVAQLQMMRQMFDELHVHFGANSSTDNRSGVSSVRQMMAGTRISDSSPYDSPSDDGNPTNSENPSVPQSQPSTSGSTLTVAPPEVVPPAPVTTSQANARARSRRNYPRCLFLMHRQYLRSARRNAARDRVQMRRNIYRRFLSSSTTNRATIDLSTVRGRGPLSLFNPDTLPEMTRRVEHYLMEHCRYIGRSVIPHTAGSNTRSDMGEHVMTLRLNNCRMRMNRLMGNFQLENNNASVTADGTSRYAARLALSSTLDTITRFVDVNPNMVISTGFRSQIWEVIELSLLLSELLLLQIVDSIPPPSGMNLDPERENLSMRIDQMCTRMISMGQSNQLARSLRLMRQTVRHATRTLGRTYTQRRNAMLPTNNESSDSRRGLLDDIHNCLRNIRRYRATDRSDDDSNFGDWYRTINDLISRYTSTGNAENSEPSTSTQETNEASASQPSVLNNETGEEIRPPAITVEDANSSDDNTNNNDLVLTMRPTSIGLYQFSRSQDDDNEEEERPNRSPNFLNVPTVQVNDVPVPDAPHPWRVRNNSRLRLSERWDELRNIGLLRPRFLHPMYSGMVNPFAFEDHLDETHREPIYDSDVIPTVTPNHRIQVWEFSQVKIPNISNSQKNLVVNECKIHNDASVDYASDGSILVTLLPSGGYMNVTNRLGVYSLEWQTLGQCLYVTSFEQNAVSVSLSPTNRHLLVGLASRRVSILPTETWTMARIFLLDYRNTTHGNLSSIRELEQNRDSNFMSLNCIRWLPTAGQGLIFGTNTGHLRLLT